MTGIVGMYSVKEIATASFLSENSNPPSIILGAGYVGGYLGGTAISSLYFDKMLNPLLFPLLGIGAP